MIKKTFLRRFRHNGTENLTWFETKYWFLGLCIFTLEDYDSPKLQAKIGESKDLEDLYCRLNEIALVFSEHLGISDSIFTPVEQLWPKETTKKVTPKIADLKSVLKSGTINIKPKFEYLFKDNHLGETFVNELGADGWELKFYYPGANVFSNYKYVFEKVIE